MAEHHDGHGSTTGALGGAVVEVEVSALFAASCAAAACVTQVSHSEHCSLSHDVGPHQTSHCFRFWQTSHDEQSVLAQEVALHQTGHAGAVGVSVLGVVVLVGQMVSLHSLHSVLSHVSALHHGSHWTISAQ